MSVGAPTVARYQFPQYNMASLEWCGILNVYDCFVAFLDQFVAAGLMRSSVCWGGVWVGGGGGPLHALGLVGPEGQRAC